MQDILKKKPKKPNPKPLILTLREETKQNPLFPVSSSHKIYKSFIKITMTKNLKQLSDNRRFGNG